MIVRTGSKSGQRPLVETRPTETLEEQPTSLLEQSVHVAEQWIGQNPTLCVGMAFALGVVLGWWIKRR